MGFVSFAGDTFVKSVTRDQRAKTITHDDSTNAKTTQIFLGPPERARTETSGADQWVLKRRELPGFARVNKVTSISLGYPRSVFNKNSALKHYQFSIKNSTLK